MSKDKKTKPKNVFNRTFRLALCAAGVAVFLCAVFGCKHKTDGTTNEEQRVSIPEGFVTVPVPKDGIPGMEPDYQLPGTQNYWKGVFVKGRTVKLSPYAIGKYEVTYKLWYEVKEWAEKNGYTFDNKGMEGGNGVNGGGTHPNYTNVGKPPTEKSEHPVTMVNWRDCIVWSNAYTEMKNGNENECVYFKKDRSALLKDATEKDGKNFVCDTAFADISKKGFRLPTEAEWEYAARWQGFEGDSVDKTNAVKHGEVYLTKLDSASGAKKPVGFDGMTIPAGESWESLRDELNRVAIYSEWWKIDDWAYLDPKTPGTAKVGSKTPNALGIYDMSGNVWEWLFDLFDKDPLKNDSLYEKDGVIINPQGAEKGIQRASRIGSWESNALKCTLGWRYSFLGVHGKRTDTQGFRLACSIR